MAAALIRRRTQTSQRLHEEACHYLPGGTSYAIRYQAPFPVYISHGLGSRVWDVDGNEYVDFWNGHGALIMGHCYKPVMEAAAKQLELGAHLGYSHEWEVKWAKQVCSMVPSAEKVRPTNSGTEANMYAVRVARAYTKRSLVGKFEGNWHGGYDALQVGVTYPVEKPSTLGLTEGATKDTVLLPFNNLDETERRVRGKNFACIIIEPVIGGGGVIPAEREFLAGLRELCTEEDIILIFDEVITGFRLAPGGAQQLYGIKPDMTTLGKVVGGGAFPAGALCGRADIMDLIDHKTHPRPYERSFHGGTYAGNPLTMRAGHALLTELAKGEAQREMNELGDYARKALRNTLESASYSAHVTGIGSMFCVHFTTEFPTDIHTANRGKDGERNERYFQHLLQNGIIYTPPHNAHFFLSAAHTKNDIDLLISATASFR